MHPPRPATARRLRRLAGKREPARGGPRRSTTTSTCASFEGPRPPPVTGAAGPGATIVAVGVGSKRHPATPSTLTPARGPLRRLGRRNPRCAVQPVTTTRHRNRRGGFVAAIRGRSAVFLPADRADRGSTTSAAERGSGHAQTDMCSPSSTPARTHPSRGCQAGNQRPTWAPVDGLRISRAATTRSSRPCSTMGAEARRIPHEARSLVGPEMRRNGRRARRSCAALHENLPVWQVNDEQSRRLGDLDSNGRAEQLGHSVGTPRAGNKSREGRERKGPGDRPEIPRDMRRKRRLLVEPRLSEPGFHVERFPLRRSFHSGGWGKNRQTKERNMGTGRRNYTRGPGFRVPSSDVACAFIDAEMMGHRPRAARFRLLWRGPDVQADIDAFVISTPRPRGPHRLPAVPSWRLSWAHRRRPTVYAADEGWRFGALQARRSTDSPADGCTLEDRPGPRGSFERPGPFDPSSRAHEPTRSTGKEAHGAAVRFALDDRPGHDSSCTGRLQVRHRRRFGTACPRTSRASPSWGRRGCWLCGDSTKRDVRASRRGEKDRRAKPQPNVLQADARGGSSP